MDNRPSTGLASRPVEIAKRSVVWREEKPGVAFSLGGLALLGSVVVPVGLAPVTDWAWVAGLTLFGLGTVSVAVGLVGLYHTASYRGSTLSKVGVLSAVIAAGAGIALVALAGIAVLGEGVLGMDFGKPVGVFAVVALAVTGGYAVGFLSFGAAGVRSNARSMQPNRLLLAGGALLLGAVVEEILGRGFGIETGLPAWTFIPVLGLVVLDTLAIGYSLRREP